MIRDLVAIFGVIAGFSYYVLTVRNAQRSQRMAEESREVEIVTRTATLEDNRIWIELLNMEWTDYDDFERKYGSDDNPDNWAKRVTVWMTYERYGYLVKNGLIDKETFFELNTSVYLVWEKFKDVIYEIRRRYSQPFGYQYFEYLGEECVKYLWEKGYDAKVPDNFFSYIPDQ